MQDRVIGLGGGQSAFLDEFLAIYPPEALTVEKNLLHLIRPLPFLAEDGTQPSADLQLTSANSRNVSDVRFDPVLPRYLYVTVGDPTIFELDPLWGRSRELANVDGASRLVIGGRDRTVYVLTPTSARAL